jgi:DTW domain-containing protein YfiP
MAVMLAQDLLAWAQRLCLEGPLASAEPKRLRYALWHTPGRLVRTARRLILRLDASWPRARALARAFQHLRSLPLSP